MAVFRAHGLCLSISGGNEASEGQEELTLVWHGWSRSVWHTTALTLASCLVILAVIHISSARLGWDPYLLSRDGIFCLELDHLRREKCKLNSFQTKRRNSVWDVFWYNPFSNSLTPTGHLAIQLNLNTIALELVSGPICKQLSPTRPAPLQTPVASPGPLVFLPGCLRGSHNALLRFDNLIE